LTSSTLDWNGQTHQSPKQSIPNRRQAAFLGGQIRLVVDEPGLPRLLGLGLPTEKLATITLWFYGLIAIVLLNNAPMMGQSLEALPDCAPV
jgi:hypothetical protein